MNGTDPIYVIYTNESYSSLPNVKPKVMIKTFNEIIKAADYELSKRGESFYDMAGIDFVENENGLEYPERALTQEERFELSVAALKHDGKLFYVFKTDKDGTAHFLSEARYYDIEEEAKDLVNSFNR